MNASVGTEAGAELGIRSLSACISVGDLDACAAWYAEHLGFTVVQSWEFPELAARVAYLEGHGARLELLEQRDAEPAPRSDPPGHGAPHGVTQLVCYVADINAALAYVRQRGLTIAMDVSTLPELNIAAFFIRDLEGNLIEFIEYSPSESSGGQK